MNADESCLRRRHELGLRDVGDDAAARWVPLCLLNGQTVDWQSFTAEALQTDCEHKNKNFLYFTISLLY